jgi:hypothetical protein
MSGGLVGGRELSILSAFRIYLNIYIKISIHGTLFKRQYTK